MESLTLDLKRIKLFVRDELGILTNFDELVENGSSQSRTTRDIEVQFCRIKFFCYLAVPIEFDVFHEGRIRDKNGEECPKSEIKAIRSVHR